jgi:hypothetical protein
MMTLTICDVHPLINAKYGHKQEAIIYWPEDKQSLQPKKDSISP